MCYAVLYFFYSVHPFHSLFFSFFFFFNDTATTEIYTLSLHDALPIFISLRKAGQCVWLPGVGGVLVPRPRLICIWRERSEEHTSELQSRVDLVCRLLLEKKKKKKTINIMTIQRSASTGLH